MEASLKNSALGSKGLVKVLLPFVLMASVWLVLEGTGVHSKIAQSGTNMLDSTLKLSHGQRLRGRRLLTPIRQQKQEARSVSHYLPSSYIVWNLIYGTIYYFLVVRNYPALAGNEDVSRGAAVMSQSECGACCSGRVSCTNLLLSACCIGPRAAHTFDKAGLLNFWIGLVLMTCCPWFTLCYSNGCTDLNERLGGEKRGCINAILCAWCCSCCVVAQDAQALDDISDVHVGLCGVSSDRPFE
jgi:hypothetical protein